MRKVLKLLFSQFAIVSFLLVLQIILLAWFILSLSQYFIFIDLFLKLISIVAVIIIMNRHSNPVYKLAWVIPILLFPLLGGLFYLFIMGQTHTAVFFKKLQSLSDKLTKPYPQDEAVLSEIEKEFPKRASLVRYINRATGLCAHRAEDAEYFETGEKFYTSLLHTLEKAEKYIFLEFFILNDGKMWQSVLDILKRKAAQGVDVRIMYDGMGSLVLLPKSFPSQIRALGIKCKVFGPFVPFLSALQNNRDHRKICVIDGKVAYTGGANISDEYINADGRSSVWKDMCVKVGGEAAFSFTIMFLKLWAHVNKETVNIEAFKPEAKESPSLNDGYLIAYDDIPLDNYQTGECVYLDVINKAEKYVYITTPYLILDHEMVVALKNASLGGIDIKIICPYVTDHWYARAVAYSYYKELTENGIEIYEYSPGFIHGKTFCSDDSVAVVGSINLDYRSLFLHFECACAFMGGSVVKNVRDDFKRTLTECRRITMKDFEKMSFVKKLLGAVLRIFAPLM